MLEATRGLRGPSRWCAEIRAELGDGVMDSYSAWLAHGLDDVTATRATLAELGNPALAAAAYARESAQQLGGRVATGLLLSGPLAAVTWLAALCTSGAAPWAAQPAGRGRAVAVLGSLVVLAAALAGAAVWSRRHPSAPVLPGVASGAAAAAASLCVSADAAMLLLFGRWLAVAPSAVWPLATWAMVFSASRLLVAGTAALRCVGTFRVVARA